MTIDHDVADLGLAAEGRRRTDWAERQMPVLRQIRERFARERPLAGTRIAVGLHITSETAVLLRTLRAGGADLALCGSNPLSTRDDICATLVVHEAIPVFARYGENLDTYYRHVAQILDREPHLVMDDGADLIVKLHERPGGEGIIGGLEETTTGVLRVRAMARQGLLKFPVVAVNDTPTKRYFDNRYGTGQNTIDGILRATNVLLAGKMAVVAGYGWAGRGIALRLRGMGANVIVTEVSPIAALEALMEGYRVLPMDEAAREADLIVTATGGLEILGPAHFASQRRCAAREQRPLRRRDRREDAARDRRRAHARPQQHRGVFAADRSARVSARRRTARRASGRGSESRERDGPLVRRTSARDGMARRATGKARGDRSHATGGSRRRHRAAETSDARRSHRRALAATTGVRGRVARRNVRPV